MMNFIIFILLIVLSYNKTSIDNNNTSNKVYKDTVFNQYFDRTSGWVAGDGAISFPFNNGKSLWLYGDSHIDHYDPKTKTVPCLFQVRNAKQIRFTYHSVQRGLRSGKGNLLLYGSQSAGAFYQ